MGKYIFISKETLEELIHRATRNDFRYGVLTVPHQVEIVEKGEKTYILTDSTKYVKTDNGYYTATESDTSFGKRETVDGVFVENIPGENYLLETSKRIWVLCHTRTTYFVVLHVGCYQMIGVGYEGGKEKVYEEYQLEGEIASVYKDLLSKIEAKHVHNNVLC